MIETIREESAEVAVDVLTLTLGPTLTYFYSHLDVLGPTLRLTFSYFYSHLHLDVLTLTLGLTLTYFNHT